MKNLNRLAEFGAIFGLAFLGFYDFDLSKYLPKVEQDTFFSTIVTNSESHEVFEEDFFDWKSDGVVDSYTVGNLQNWAFNAKLYPRWMMSDEMKDYVDSRYLYEKSAQR